MWRRFHKYWKTYETHTPTAVTSPHLIRRLFFWRRWNDSTKPQCLQQSWVSSIMYSHNQVSINWLTITSENDIDYLLIWQRGQLVRRWNVSNEIRSNVQHSSLEELFAIIIALYHFKEQDKISICAFGGRITIPLIYGKYQADRFDVMKGEIDLTYRNGKFYLLCTMDVPENDPIVPTDYLGVDFGIVNIAADSDGNTYTGATVEQVRRKHHRNRKTLQRKGTKGAKKRLKKLAGREARFRKHENHVISKTVVKLAKGTDRGIVLENLKGINGRTTVRRSDRARHFRWSFSQLRSFIEYKAKLVGVPVIAVDPRNTSRTCNICGHCEKANRTSQAIFLCKSCGYSVNADFNAARNLAGLGRYKAASELTGIDPGWNPGESSRKTISALC